MKRRRYRGSRVQRAVDIQDLREMAARRLPGFVREYLEGGAEGELTLNRNRKCFEAVSFQHRACVDVSTRSVAGSIFGEETGLPCAIAPTGFNGLLWKHADLALARAALRHRIPFTVSTVSSDSLEVIAKEVGGRLWFQLYVIRDQNAVDQLLARADHFGCEALVVTVDAPVLGNRSWDARNYSAPLRLTARATLDVLLHPRWIANVFLPGGLPQFGNLAEFLPPDRRSALDGARYMGQQMNNSLGWDDIARLRERWPRKLVVKGLLAPADVEQAVRLGADAVVLSNHGGRQLDGDATAIDALADALAVTRGRAAVLVDGGIRRGSDIAKAMALGADAVLVGRATLYGVAAGGEAGAVRALEILQGELDRVLALVGCPRLADLSSSFLRSPTPHRAAERGAPYREEEPARVEGFG